MRPLDGNARRNVIKSALLATLRRKINIGLEGFGGPV